MNARDEALTWRCGQDRLVGILSAPVDTAPELGVVVVVGGPQYRAGSHRQFTLLARELAAAGFAVLRFDSRGMGDSEGEARDFEGVSDDIASAIDALHRRLSGLRQVVLWGLCDGASAALLYAHAKSDPRLAGLCLLNPWVRSEQGLAKARVKHYYLHRLRQKDFWLKLLHGKVAPRAALDLARNVGRAASTAAPAAAKPSFQQRMLDGWMAFDGAILLVLSGNDLTAQEFVQTTRDDPRWARALSSPRVQRHEVAQADHTFSSALAHRELAKCSANWLAKLAGPAPVPTPCSVANRQTEAHR